MPRVDGSQSRCDEMKKMPDEMHKNRAERFLVGRLARCWGEIFGVKIASEYGQTMPDAAPVLGFWAEQRCSALQGATLRMVSSRARGLSWRGYFFDNNILAN